METARLKLTAPLLGLIVSALACSGLTDSDLTGSEQAVAGSYSLAQLNGQSLPARYDTTCEFPGTAVPPRPGDNRALSGSLVLLDERRQFEMYVSIEASCGPNHLVRNTPGGGGTWKIDPTRPNTVLFSTFPHEAALEGRKITVQSFLSGASGAPVRVTLLFMK